jgi:predicted AlkP superfamily pyrophosphatase or phosphodiesterase
MYRRKILTALLVLALAGMPAGPAAGQAPTSPGQTRAAKWRPKLIVVLVVDQLREDYMERFGVNWTGGLRRLMDSGAWFRQAAFPYWNTVTCPGHATISTGTFPRTHGMVLNEWWDRAAAAQQPCTADPSVQIVSYGAPSTAQRGESARHLLAATLTDELRAQLGESSRIVSFSLKERSAIMLGGRRPTAVTWMDGRGNWVTSTAFVQAPLPWLETYIKAHPVDADFRKTWTKLLPETAYQFEDNAPGERGQLGAPAVFPVAMVGRGETPDNAFYSRWKTSPFSDVYLAELAKHAVDALGLGRGAGTDYLGVSFSALDYLGHDVGPHSHEVQDLLARLDVTIGGLLEHLDKTVGRENYVVALSADHGVAPLPERMQGLGFDAGGLVTSEMLQRIEKVLEPVLGPGPHIARLNYTDLYFKPGVYDKLRVNREVLETVEKEILATPGVLRVFRAEQLEALRASDDPHLRLAATSHRRDRSGDLLIFARPYWFPTSQPRAGGTAAGTTHGSGYNYDTRVPVILMGPPFRAGEYLNPATPADIAPTLATLVGVTLANPDGRVLHEAIVVPAPTPPAKSPPPKRRP